MSGRNALWLPGLDHASIATQSIVEKTLLKKGIKREELGQCHMLCLELDLHTHYRVFKTNMGTECALAQINPILIHTATIECIARPTNSDPLSML